MKPSHIFQIFGLLALLAAGCRKEEPRHVATEIDIHDPEISTLNDGRKRLDFVVEVTQIGNYYYQDFDFTLSKFFGTAVLDSFHTSMPTAREFVRHSVTVDGPGDYDVEVFIGKDGNGSGVGRLVKVPQ